MATCHQAHNIPWSSFLELLEKVPVTPPSHYFESKGIFDAHNLVFTVDESGKVANKMKFFANKIQSAIKEFSQTERRKYADKNIDSITRIYESDLCNEWVKECKLQDISAWESPEEISPYQDTVLEIFKELFIQEKVGQLLRLARSGVQLEFYRFVTHSNFFHYGIGRIQEDCLTLYIHLNILIANGTLCDPSKWHAQWSRFLDEEILRFYDGNSSARMYQQYFKDNPKFEDLNGLGELLKKLFKMLYIYDMIMNERNVVISWEKEVLKCVGSYFLNRTKDSSNLWYEQIEKMT